MAQCNEYPKTFNMVHDNKQLSCSLIRGNTYNCSDVNILLTGKGEYNDYGYEIIKYEECVRRVEKECDSDQDAYIQCLRSCGPTVCTNCKPPESCYNKVRDKCKFPTNPPII